MPGAYLENVCCILIHLLNSVSCTVCLLVGELEGGLANDTSAPTNKNILL